VAVGVVVSIRLAGEVQVVVLEALSEIVTLQVAPLVLPVVQVYELLAIPEEASELPVRVKVVVPLFFQGEGLGDQVPQVGAVLSTPKLRALVSLE
jgi:hypothetical protein